MAFNYLSKQSPKENETLTKPIPCKSIFFLKGKIPAASKFRAQLKSYPYNISMDYPVFREDCKQYWNLCRTQSKRVNFRKVIRTKLIFGTSPLVVLTKSLMFARDFAPMIIKSSTYSSGSHLTRIPRSSWQII